VSETKEKQLRVSPELHRKVKLLASEEGMEMMTLTDKFVMEGLARYSSRHGGSQKSDEDLIVKDAKPTDNRNIVVAGKEAEFVAILLQVLRSGNKTARDVVAASLEAASDIIGLGGPDEVGGGPRGKGGRTR
jgi:hypothetical protein